INNVPIDPATFTGCGLDGVADVQKVITFAPTRSSGNQYNARVDFNPRVNDQFAVSFYITPLNSVGGDTGANGRPMADLSIDPRTGAPTDVHKSYRQRDFSLFVQDDLKVRPNLTLNIGLRYEFFAPLSEKFNRQSNLILGSGANPLQSASLKLGGDLYPADKNNFAPRLGFAWTPSNYISKTVIRGGFGVAYNRITDTMTGISRVNPPFLFREGNCCA